MLQYAFVPSQQPRATEPAIALVGKSYADDRGQHTFQIMRELNHKLAQQADKVALAVPQALFYDPNLRLLAQQRVVGMPYADIIHQPELAEHLLLAGSALAFLHNQKLSLGREVWLRDHLADLLYPQPAKLGEQLPEYQSRVEALIAEMKSQERTMRPRIELGPLHRNFHPRKVLYSEGRAWVVDWDLFARGDPALDVGNFIVHLQVQLGRQCKHALGAFIEGYFNTRPLLLLERVPLYAAFAYLRLACEALRDKEPDWEERAGEYLHLGETCLATRSLG